MNLATLQSETDDATAQSTAAKLLHPEDISVGDDVTLAIESYDYPSFVWCMTDPAIMPPDQTIRLSFIPSEVSKPFKVVAVCLPFVLCEKVDGKFRTFDVRKVQLMRLAPGFAEAARMGYATKKRKKAIEAERLQKQQETATNEPDVDSFELGKGVAFVCPLPVDVEPVSVNALVANCGASSQVVLFEFAVQIPFADPENVGRFFSVVVSQS